MKIIALSDLHQMSSKWKELVKIVRIEKPDIVLIAGDILPKDNGILNQLSYKTHLEKYAKQIKETGAKLVLILGNDDNQLYIPWMIQKDNEEKLWYYLENSFCDIDGYRFVGMPFVLDYPWAYKYWIRSETKENLAIDIKQYDDPIVIDKNNQYQTIPNYPNYLSEKESLWEILDKLGNESKNQRCIYLIHMPPSGARLGICKNGSSVGSDSVLKFIEKYQPLITIHGHIHESPEYNGGIWYQRIGKTYAIQAGQITPKLYYTIIFIDDQSIEVNHSIYGKGKE